MSWNGFFGCLRRDVLLDDDQGVRMRLLSSLSARFAVLGISTVSVLLAPVVASDNEQVQRLLTQIDVASQSAVTGPVAQGALAAHLSLRISCDFRDADLAEIIDFFRRTTSLNFVLDPQLQTEPLSFTATDMQLGTALQWLARLANCHLGYVHEAAYFSATPVAGPQRVVFYDIRELSMPIEDFPGHQLAIPTP